MRALAASNVMLCVVSCIVMGSVLAGCGSSHKKHTDAGGADAGQDAGRDAGMPMTQRDGSVTPHDSGTSGNSCATGDTRCEDHCVDTRLDPRHCGACDHACPKGEVCDGKGECAQVCPPYLVLCDGKCVDPQNDSEHCGARGKCSGAASGNSCKSGELCAAGRCSISCGAGLLRCDESCVNPQTDRVYCGAHGDCSGAATGDLCEAGEVCSAGSCALSCQNGFIDCGGRCIDPLTDHTFCGAANSCMIDPADAGAETTPGKPGQACGTGEVCSAGHCALSCKSPQIACHRSCVDPASDKRYCGASAGCGESGGVGGSMCSGAEQCIDGKCTLICPQGELTCGTSCVDPSSDAKHCGATLGCGVASGSAGKTCADGNLCQDGVCKLACPPGQLICNGKCIDPKSDHDHCGAVGECGTPSGSPGTNCGANKVCNGSGSCTPSCSTGFAYCGTVCTLAADCPPCGNGGACDVTNVGGATCQSLGYNSGIVICDIPTCTLDTSLCTNMSGGGGAGGGGAGG